MTLHFDLFWSFRSPYSYLAAPRLLALTEEYDVTCHFRPVYPLAVRVKDFFKSVNPLWPAYVMHDLPREAERLGLKIQWPQPDPIVQDLSTLSVAEKQPYITRLTRLGAEAQNHGQGLAFAVAVSARIWGGVQNWDQGEVLSQAADDAGLSLPELDAEIATQSPQLDEQILQNEADQKSGGHWGVPLMVFNGEPFFGQDRIDSLIWRMQQNGLQRK